MTNDVPARPRSERWSHTWIRVFPALDATDGRESLALHRKLALGFLRDDAMLVQLLILALLAAVDGLCPGIQHHRRRPVFVGCVIGTIVTPFGSAFSASSAPAAVGIALLIGARLHGVRRRARRLSGA